MRAKEITEMKHRPIIVDKEQATSVIWDLVGEGNDLCDVILFLKKNGVCYKHENKHRLPTDLCKAWTLLQVLYHALEPSWPMSRWDAKYGHQCISLMIEVLEEMCN